MKFRTVLLGCLLHGASVPALAFEAAGKMFPVTLRVQEKDQRRLKTHNKPGSLEVLSLVVLVAAGPRGGGDVLVSGEGPGAPLQELTAQVQGEGLWWVFGGSRGEERRWMIRSQYSCLAESLLIPRVLLC